MKEYSTAQLVQEFLHLVTEFAIYIPLQCQVPIELLPSACHTLPATTHMLNRSLLILQTHHHTELKDDDIQVDFAFLCYL